MKDDDAEFETGDGDATLPSASLGAWSVEGLVDTAAESSGPGADTDVDEATRFIRGVASVVRRREAAGTDARRISVFLLHPRPTHGVGLPHVPMLDQGRTPIAGNIWFVNAPVVSGRPMELTTDDPGAIFDFVENNLKLGSIATVLVDPREDKIQVRFYPQGLSSPDAVRILHLNASDVTIAEISQIIDAVHKQCLITPEAQPRGNKLWSDSSKVWPKRDAEDRVQAALKPAFAATFPSCRIYDEIKGVYGRADLHIEEQDPLDPRKTTYLVVLELKVLRSYSETGSSYSDTEIREWIESGVKQAAAYRTERGHHVAALCCFDMRRNDDADVCLTHVRELAAKLGVELRRWYLYASSSALRSTGY